MNTPRLVGAMLALVALTIGGAQAQQPAPQPTASEGIDSLLDAARLARGVESSGPCSDQVFVRRAYLDVIGVLPGPLEVRAFLDDRSPDKRAKLVDALFERPEFADYWAMRWCDVLRVKSEFPINLWPNATQAYGRWVRDSIRANKPYDQFARELLTSSGSNFRVPPANFYRAVQGRDANALAGAVALTFMGTRIETWPEPQRAGMAAFFSRLTYKKTEEWKEEIVCLDPAPAGPVDAVFPDGVPVRIPAGPDPRHVFADWLVHPGNPWFARSVANRVWAWLMGRGIVEEPDDIRPDNPPSCPELLAYLEGQLVESRYDLRRLYRLILNSKTYQQSPVPRSEGADAAALFASYPVRLLDAEVLVDALDGLTGGRENYSSPIPEPYTYVPPEERTVALADGSITSAFLDMFGRPARDTGLASERGSQPTDSQRLYLLNSADLQAKIGRSPLLRKLLWSTRGRPRELVTWMYLALLSRYPTDAERAATESYLAARGQSQKDAADDLAWALINTKEFLFRH